MGWENDEITQKQENYLYFLGYTGPKIKKKGIASSLITDFLSNNYPFFHKLKQLRNYGYTGPRPATELEYDDLIGLLDDKEVYNEYKKMSVTKTIHELIDSLKKIKRECEGKVYLKEKERRDERLEKNREYNNF